MPLNGSQISTLWESFRDGASDFNGARGAEGFVCLMQDLMGVVEDHNGRRIDFSRRRVRPEEITLRELAESIMGYETAHRYFGAEAKMAGLEALREDAVHAVMPGAFMNASTWNAAAAGLLEVKIMEAYQRPGMIGDQLAEIVPTRLRTQRLLGITGIGDKAEAMQPGQRHPRVQLGEERVTTPETQKYGMGIDVTREAVFFDATNGRVMQEAEEIGTWMAWRREREIIDQFIGAGDVTNTKQYTYNGTAYDTYQTASPWINDHSNPLTDWEDVNDAIQLSVNMTDPALGEPVVYNPRQMLVMPANIMNARRALNATVVETETQTGAVRTIGSNPLSGVGLSLIEASVLVASRIVTAHSVTAAQAADWWFLGDFKRAFKYYENWAMNVRRASPSDYIMLDHDLVLSIFVNEMGVSATVDPRAVIRNKH
jgi:hypothetical protein